ncbi:metalloprotease TIKI1-like [Mytilus californianus]|uniref:metalloprotease TIKI1-like n=1 Tax=Mytilus californianus TaxID=6549 RepID=UPI002246DF54|nr:metalloprotease TIKI1-like [Mytilus californianus]
MIYVFIVFWFCLRCTLADLNTQCDTHDQSKSYNSFLWKVKRDPPAYFFGTIHVPYTRVWDYIPENTKMAFDQSDNIVFELELTNPYTVSALANCQLLPGGEKLANILPAEIYTRLKQHLEYVRVMLPVWMTADQKGRGLYADYLFNAIAGNWERKRPVWVMLMVNSLNEHDIKSRGIPVLDLYLAQVAERESKVTGAIERVEEQCVPLNDLNFSQVVFALNQTLWKHELSRQLKSEFQYTTEDLIHHYNCGDLNSVIFNHDLSNIPNLVNNTLPPKDLQTAKLIDNYFRMELIDKRNQRMAARSSSLLKAHPQKTFFFAFGAGHFLGNDTVIDKMKREGFEIEHVQPGDEIPLLNGEKKRKHRRRKLKDKNSIYGDIWFDMDEETREWLERQSERQRNYKTSFTKPFNDLWIRMDANSPNLYSKLAEKYGYDRTERPTDVPYSRASTCYCSIQMLILFVILFIYHS